MINLIWGVIIGIFLWQIVITITYTITKNRRKTMWFSICLIQFFLLIIDGIVNIITKIANWIWWRLHREHRTKNKYGITITTIN